MLLSVEHTSNIISFCRNCNTFLKKNFFGYFPDILLTQANIDIAERRKNMKTLDKEKVVVEFGRFIREARETKGLLQADVAEKLGVSRSYYGHIEIGRAHV